MDAPRWQSFVKLVILVVPVTQSGECRCEAEIW